jgi:hypothetical protein
MSQIVFPHNYDSFGTHVTTAPTTVYVCPEGKESQIITLYCTNVSQNNDNVFGTVQVYLADENKIITIAKDVRFIYGRTLDFPQAINLLPNDELRVKCNLNNALDVNISVIRKNRVVNPFGLQLTSPHTFGRVGVYVSTSPTVLLTCPEDKSLSIHTLYISNVADNNDNVYISLEKFYNNTGATILLCKDTQIKHDDYCIDFPKTINLQSGDQLKVKCNSNEFSHAYAAFVSRSNT